MNHEHFHVDVSRKRCKAFTSLGDAYVKKVAAGISKHVADKPEYALGVLADEAYYDALEELVRPLRFARHVVVIGIGGSSLGTEAVYHAVAMRTNARLHVFDAIEDESIVRMRELVATIGSPEEISVVIVTKSGTTTETIVNAVAFMEVLESRFKEAAKDRVICIGTDGSDFLQQAKGRGVRTAAIPPSIGGRFSVFTACGIVPLLLLGIDVVSLREGARDALLKKGRDAVVANAATLATLATEGIHTVNFFTFNERLRMLGFWYRQLIAESVGKRMTTKHATFSHQLLPVITTSPDLHSMTQLYLGGYQGIFTHFVYGDTESLHHALSDHWLMRHLTLLRGHTPQEVRNVIRESVIAAYDDLKLPYRMTSMKKITAYEIGHFMASLMLEVMCFGAMHQIDVFDQPDVETYKKHTRARLTKKKKK